jgi:MFS family permease
VSDLVPAADRVRAFGLVYWVINVGFAIGLTLGGLIAARSYFWLFVGDGATTLLFAGLILLGVPESRPPRTPYAHRAPHPLAEFFAPYRDLHFLFFLGLSFLFAVVFMQNATTFPLDMTAHGIPKSVYGRVLALNGVIIVLVQPFLGPWLASRDRSRVMAVGSALVGLGFGMNALSGRVPVYVLGVIVWTIGEMFVLPVANAAVAELAPSHIRGRYQGAYSLAFGLAVCAAPPLGMLVLEKLGGFSLWSACLATGLLVGLGHLALARARARYPMAAEAPRP